MSRYTDAMIVMERAKNDALIRIAELEATLVSVQEHGRAAVLAERVACRDIALAIDSGRGNEKEIAAAIMRRDT